MDIMFNLDIEIFNFIYNQCKALGSAFYLGAFEGFVMYLGLITATVSKIKWSKKR